MKRVRTSFEEALRWLKEWSAVLLLLGAALGSFTTGLYYWNDARAARRANQIASLSSSASIVAVASDVFYGVGIDKSFLQQIIGRRVVVRLANVGSVPTSLVSVTFDGYLKGVRRYQLAEQPINITYGKSTWEPFIGYTGFVWREEPPRLSFVIINSLEKEPWRLEKKGKSREATSFDADSVQKELKKGGIQPKKKVAKESRLRQDYSISGTELPIAIPANSTVDVTVDVLVRVRAVVDDSLPHGLRKFRGVDRGLKGTLTLGFPDADSVQLHIDERNEIASLEFNHSMVNSSPLSAAVEYQLAQEMTSITYEMVPRK